jgi:hypothetical protein
VEKKIAQQLPPNLTLPKESYRQKMQHLRLKEVVRQIQKTTTSKKLTSYEKAPQESCHYNEQLKTPRSLKKPDNTVAKPHSNQNYLFSNSPFK